MENLISKGSVHKLSHFNLLVRIDKKNALIYCHLMLSKNCRNSNTQNDLNDWLQAKILLLSLPLSLFLFDFFRFKF